MEMERYQEIKAFCDYITQQCLERHMTQREVSVVIAHLMDGITHDFPEDKYEQALKEVTDLTRGLRMVFAKQRKEFDA